MKSMNMHSPKPFVIEPRLAYKAGFFIIYTTTATGSWCIYSIFLTFTSLSRLVFGEQNLIANMIHHKHDLIVVYKTDIPAPCITPQLSFSTSPLNLAAQLDT